VVIRRVIAPRIDFSALRRELELPERFPPAAQAEADRVAAGPPPLPGTDHTALTLVTIDPPTSMDLDQAMCLARRPGGGYRVHYAIADVAAYVPARGALADETWRRGETVYLPDGNVPLHPRTLSEGAASLLPDQIRAAVVWTIDLDATGDTVAVDVTRAAVRSRAKLNYAGVQADAGRGTLPEPIALLPRSVRCSSSAASSAAPSTHRSPNRRSSPPAAAGVSCCAPRIRWRTSTRRSPSSPAWRPGASC